MKRKLVALVLVVATLFAYSSCNTHSKVNNDGIPMEFKTLEFYNGGACIGSFNNVKMEIIIVTSTKLTTDNINFYKYHITSKEQHINKYILDSESLAIVYEELDDSE